MAYRQTTLSSKPHLCSLLSQSPCQRRSLVTSFYSLSLRFGCSFLVLGGSTPFLRAKHNCHTRTASSLSTGTDTRAVINRYSHQLDKVGKVRIWWKWGTRRRSRLCTPQ